MGAVRHHRWLYFVFDARDHTDFGNRAPKTSPPSSTSGGGSSRPCGDENVAVLTLFVVLCSPVVLLSSMVILSPHCADWPGSAENK